VRLASIRAAISRLVLNAVTLGEQTARALSSLLSLHRCSPAISFAATVVNRITFAYTLPLRRVSARAPGELNSSRGRRCTFLQSAVTRDSVVTSRVNTSVPIIADAFGVEGINGNNERRERAALSCAPRIVQLAIGLMIE